MEGGACLDRHVERKTKTKVGIRTSQWRGGDGSGVRGKTIGAGF
jgi:hypothetical protein